MQTVASTVSSLSRGDFLISVDLLAAYLSPRPCHPQPCKVCLLPIISTQHSHLAFPGRYPDQSSITVISSQSPVWNIESLVGSWFHHQYQEKFLDSVHQSNSPGGRNRHLGSYHLAPELQEACHSTILATTWPPGVMYRDHSMSSPVTHQSPSSLHPKGLGPLPRMHERSSTGSNTGTQLPILMVSPQQYPQYPQHVCLPSRSSSSHN